MGFFSDLTGKTSAKAATALGQRNEQRLTNDYNMAFASDKTGYETASNRMIPFLQGGQQGYKTYADAMGVNGAGARDAAFGTFQSDPFLAYARQNSGTEINNIFKRYNAQGAGNSGASMMAVSRAAGERAQGDVNSWLNRMYQLGQGGQEMARAQAGLDTSYYTGTGDRYVNRANAMTGNDTQATMAANNARMAGVNNVLGAVGMVGGLAARAATGGAFGGFGGGGGGWVNPDTGRSYNSWTGGY